MDFKIEVVMLPVADVDRAKGFYGEKMGFRLDVDHQPSDEFRVVQFTPQGSACSVVFGVGVTKAAPGATQGTHLVVNDIEAAHAELAGRGVDIGGIRHFAGEWIPGADPEHRDYTSFADFTDPDGNGWVLQEVGHGG
jgi:catechol 2,3-dioxygenase-like lactoylglutathione lyase family enzyme